tara:strand:+ start:849 stop:986 length:138 start_codon:yes stop_codon:yes gene_type:complete
VDDLAKRKRIALHVEMEANSLAIVKEAVGTRSLKMGWRIKQCFVM